MSDPIADESAACVFAGQTHMWDSRCENHPTNLRQVDAILSGYAWCPIVSVAGQRHRLRTGASGRWDYRPNASGRQRLTQLQWERTAEAGIPAYRRLELQPAPHLITYTLAGEHYVAASTLHAGQLGELAAPFPVRLDPAELTRRRGPGGH